ENPQLRARGLERLRRDLLTRARDYYDQFARQQSDDPALEAMRGRAYGRLARVTAELGARDEAARLHQQAREVFERLRPPHPLARLSVRGWARPPRGRASLRGPPGRKADAPAARGDASPRRGRLPRDHPAVTGYQVELARTVGDVSRLDLMAGRLDSAGTI